MTMTNAQREEVANRVLAHVKGGKPDPALAGAESLCRRFVDVLDRSAAAAEARGKAIEELRQLEPQAAVLVDLLVEHIASKTAAVPQPKLAPPKRSTRVTRRG